MKRDTPVKPVDFHAIAFIGIVSFIVVFFVVTCVSFVITARAYVENEAARQTYSSTSSERNH